MNHRRAVRRRVTDALLRGGIYASAAGVVVVLAAMLGYVFYRGLPQLTWSFLTGQRSELAGTVGIFPNLLTTLYLIVLTLLLAMPIGIGGAIYLNEYAPSCRLAAGISFAAETLAGIPSILYGLVGYLIFVPLVGRACVLAGGLTLSVMVLPLILRTTQEALKTVPVSYREGAAALGATKWHLLRTIVLPEALDGILGGGILAVGRILGESAALLLTAGTGYQLIPNLGKALRSSGGTLSVMLYVAVSERGEYQVGFAIAALLLLLGLFINAGVRGCRYLRKKRGERNAATSQRHHHS